MMLAPVSGSHEPDARTDRETTHTVELTAEQIAFLHAALDDAERASADTSYDPQVQDWAIQHPSGAGETIAAIREALRSPEERHDPGST